MSKRAKDNLENLADDDGHSARRQKRLFITGKIS
jgi:hypothetical protein